MKKSTLKVGDLILDCGNCPGVIIEIYSDSIEYLGLIHSGVGSCHPVQCSPEKINAETAAKYVQAYLKYGEMGTWLLRGLDKKEYLAFEKNWRLGTKGFCAKCHKYHYADAHSGYKVAITKVKES